MKRLMKNYKYFTAWTNYPTLLQQHDPNDDFPPLYRQVQLVSYDGDKYITIHDDRDFQEVKRGYIYRNRRRTNFKHSTLIRRLPLTEYN